MGITRLGPRRVRLSAAALCFVASASITVGLVRWTLEKAAIPEGDVGVALGINAAFPLAIMAKPQFFGRMRVGFLGDSSVIFYPKGKTVHDRLQQVLNKRAKGRFRVLPFGAPGFSSVEYYAFSQAIARAHPDRLVIPLNLASLSRQWRAQWDRLEALGWLPPSRVPEALSLPLYSWGLTLDRLLSYVALVDLGLGSRWYEFRKAQVRASRGLQELRQRVQRRWGLPGGGEPPVNPELFPGRRDRFRASRLEAMYSDALAGASPSHPALVLVRAALRTFKEAGIPTLLYVSPINVEHLQRVGLDSRPGLDRTIETVRRLAEEEGADFLDLHDLLPDAGFRDAPGHFAYEGKIDGPMVVAQRIAEALLQGPPARTGAARQALR